MLLEGEGEVKVRESEIENASGDRGRRGSLP